jgi:DNA polymerase-3 subunit delta'
MLFTDIVGQEPLKKRLIQTVKEARVSHAWLFFGPEGSGVLPLAIAFTRYLLCTSRGDRDACGNCPSCNKVSKYIHPDLHFIYPVNKTRSLDKDSVVSDDFIAIWRDFLLQQPYGRLTQWYDAIDLENRQGMINTEESKRLLMKMNLKPFESDYKVVIIWYPEKMNDHAANKLLKMLEEPPPMTIFLMAGENPDQLLSTIRSRCMQVKVPRIADEDLHKTLLIRHDLTTDKVTDLVRLAAGNYLRATELLSEEEDLDFNFTKFRDLMRLSFTKNIPELVRITEDLSLITREKQKSFLEYGLRAIRESLALHFNTPGIIYLSENERVFMSNFAPFVNGMNVVPVSDEINRAIADIERNGNSRIIFLDLALKLSGLIKK